jgi:hypothetical protein
MNLKIFFVRWIASPLKTVSVTDAAPSATTSDRS